MKIMTILGTRPEIIRLSLLIPLLDAASKHVLVHTGQNFDDGLDAVFFRDLGVRAPDVNLGVRGDGFGAQAAAILAGVDPLLAEHRPDRVLILGDTNSGLAAIPARRRGIPVYHMEAGNRCYDDRVPEEVNRRIIDHSSSVLLPYTNGSRQNLLREGFAADRVYVTGNPIFQVLTTFSDRVGASDVHSRLGLEPGGFFLVTAHRSENVDREDTLRAIIDALAQLHDIYRKPIVCSLHPRTASKIARFGVNIDRAGLVFLPPLGFFDFIALLKTAFCTLSDSGTVQEEACIFRVPNVTLREVTERPETVECGSNILAGTQQEHVVHAVQTATSLNRSWDPPTEYVRPLVAETVARIVLGFRAPDPAEIEWREGKRV